MRIDFWVEASLEVGMGHLVRAANLYKKLKQMGHSGVFAGALDNEAAIFAMERGIAVEEHLEPSSDMVVVDCLNLPESIEDLLSRYRIRASLTALATHPALPTHYFLRSRPSERRHRAEYIIQPNFVLAGLQTEVIEELQFRNIHVGVCLSAGKELDEWELVAELLTSAAVGSVSVISRADHRQELSAQDRVGYSEPSRSPWVFLKPINVFVGGDGVMIGEAMAKGLPVFSITDALGTMKNGTLFETGAIYPVRRDLGETRALAALVTDVDILEGLRSSSLAFLKSASRRGLTEAIVELREGSYGI